MEIFIGVGVFNLVFFYIASLMMLYEDYEQIRVKDLFFPIRGNFGINNLFEAIIVIFIIYIFSPFITVYISMKWFLDSNFGNKVVFERKVKDRDD